MSETPLDIEVFPEPAPAERLALEGAIAQLLELERAAATPSAWQREALDEGVRRRLQPR